MQKIIIAIIVMIVFLGCSKSSTTEATSAAASASQFVYLRCLLNTSYGQKAYVRGELYSDKSVLFDYCKINGLTVTSHTNTYECLKFGVHSEYVTSNVDNLVCEIKTSAGQLNGSLTGLPVTPFSIILSHLYNDTLKQNDTLTVSWDNSNANFYHLKISSWTEIGSLDLDTLVSGCSVKLSYNSFFKGFNGNIYYFYLMPVCGPVPGKDAKANLTGTSSADGLGYFYFYGPQAYNMTQIYLGTGSTNSKMPIPAPKTEDELAADLDKAIMKKLGVSK